MCLGSCKRCSRRSGCKRWRQQWARQRQQKGKGKAVSEAECPRASRNLSGTAKGRSYNASRAANEAVVGNRQLFQKTEESAYLPNCRRDETRLIVEVEEVSLLYRYQKKPSMSSCQEDWDTFDTRLKLRPRSFFEHSNSFEDLLISIIRIDSKKACCEY